MEEHLHSILHAAPQHAAGGVSSSQSVASKGAMSEGEQDERRRQIQSIMADPSLSQPEKNKAIQCMMDGRRRSISSVGTHSVASHTSSAGGNYASSMARVAAQAHEYYSSDEEGTDAVMDDALDDLGVAHAPSSAATAPLPSNGPTPEDMALAYGYDRYDEASVASSVTHTTSCDHPPSSHPTSVSAASGPGAAARASDHSHHPHHAAAHATAAVLPGTYRQVHGRSYSLQDWGIADRPAAAASATILFDNPAQISRLMETSRPQCDHYDRNCTIVAPCCGLAFGCRICHDECPALPKPLARRVRRDEMESGADHGHPGHHNHPTFVRRLEELKLQQQQKMERRRSMPIDFDDEEENHHNIDRFAIREVICRQCYTRQSSKTNRCMACDVQFGDYHCPICNLWMSAHENPYHCEDCGFCRVGGRENFRHCNDCGMCIDTLLFDDHNCKAGKYMSDCPICQENLFESRLASHEMPCGHAIHWHCFKELTSYDTRCPVCKKTAEMPEHMASTWSAIAMGIALQPVPAEMARAVDIFCNDCEECDTNRRWHFLGVRCLHCLSFNTTVERILMQGRDAAEFLDELEASRSTAEGVPANINIAITSSSSRRNTRSSGGGVDDDDDDGHMDEDIPSAQETASGSTDPRLHR